MIRDSMDVKVTLGTTDTEDTATVSLTTGLGLTAAEAAAVRRAEIMSRTSSAGVRKACVAKAAISGTNLVLTEGSDAFVTGDVYIVRLYFGSMPGATAVMSAA